MENHYYLLDELSKAIIACDDDESEEAAGKALSGDVEPSIIIDTAIKAGFGFRLGVMGLIEFVDLGGVDILFHAGNYLHDKLGGEQFNPPRLVRKKMAREETGPRTGKGFYNYKNVDNRSINNS